MSRVNGNTDVTGRVIPIEFCLSRAIMTLRGAYHGVGGGIIADAILADALYVAYDAYMFGWANNEGTAFSVAVALSDSYPQQHYMCRELLEYIGNFH